MRDRKRLVAGVAALLAVAVLNTGRARAGETEEVESAVAGFYTALNAMFTGDMAAMDALWSHASDVTYLPPDGRLLVGWANVRASWQEQANRKLGGRVEPADVHIVVTGDVAAVCNLEKGTNQVNGVEQTVAIRSSKVFRRENGVWKLFSDHADPLPFFKK